MPHFDGHYSNGGKPREAGLSLIRQIFVSLYNVELGCFRISALFYGFSLSIAMVGCVCVGIEWVG